MSSFAPALRAELAKLRTVRGFRVGLVLSALSLPLFSLLVVSDGGLGAGDTVTSGAATGSVVAHLGFGAWAATLAGSEYVNGTMAVSLATVPRRSVLYAAKVAAGALVAGVASLLAAVVSFLIVLGVTPDGHRTGNPSALLGIVLATVAVSAVGVAVGVLTRSSTAAIAVVAAAILLPKTAAGLLGDLQEWVVGASPGTVVTQFVSGAQLAADQRFPGGAAAAASAMLAVAALAVLVAAAAFHRRDG